MVLNSSKLAGLVLPRPAGGDLLLRSHTSGCTFGRPSLGWVWSLDSRPGENRKEGEGVISTGVEEMWSVESVPSYLTRCGEGKLVWLGHFKSRTESVLYSHHDRGRMKMVFGNCWCLISYLTSPRPIYASIKVLKIMFIQYIFHENPLE